MVHKMYKQIYSISGYIENNLSEHFIPHYYYYNYYITDTYKVHLCIYNCHVHSVASCKR